MKLIPFLILILLFIFPAKAQTDQEKLLALDLAWEKALLESDVEFLDQILSDQFIWVHDHASLIDGKKEVVHRARQIQDGQSDNTRNRSSSEQKVVIQGKTGVVSGFTIVDRGPKPTRYHFMRTYAWVDGKWKLMANHTMAIPED